MNDTLMPIKSNVWIEATQRPTLFLARKILIKLLSKLKIGQITLRDGTSMRTFGRSTPNFPFSATLTISDPMAYTYIAFGGSIGGVNPTCSTIGMWMTLQSLFVL